MKKYIITILLTVIFPIILVSQDNSKSLSFKDNAYVNMGNVNYKFENQLTVMGWLKWTISPTEGEKYANIITINSSNRINYGQFWIQHNSDNKKLEFALQIENDRQFVWSNTEMEKDKWVHFAATYNGEQQKLYINGVEEAHKARSGKIKSFEPEFTLTLGAWAASGFSRNFDGELDEISIWKRALTQKEIRSMMCRTIILHEAGLVSYYSMDELQDALLIDPRSNKNGHILKAIQTISTAPIGNESVFTYFDDEETIYTEACAGHPLWNAEDVYERTAGEAGTQVLVVYEDKLYRMAENKWWSRGDIPGQSPMWLHYADCGTMIDLCQFATEWDSDINYQRAQAGEQIFVTRHGALYELAIGDYWSKNHPPEKPQNSQYWTYTQNCYLYQQPTCGEHIEWQSDITYQKTNQTNQILVFYKNNIYKLKSWHSFNHKPDANPDKWENIGVCDDFNKSVNVEKSQLNYGGFEDALTLNAIDHSITTSEFTGKPIGIHIYKVNQIENVPNIEESEIV